MSNISEVLLRSFADNAPEGGEGFTVETREQDGNKSDWLVYRNEDLEVVAMIIVNENKQVFGFVLPKYRRQGIGTMVWNYAVKNLGIKKEDQITTDDAKAFFESPETS